MLYNLVKILFVLGILGAVSAAALSGGAVPKDTRVITLDLMEGKKGAVTFQHAKHAEDYKKQDGSKILCRDCHHTVKVEVPKTDQVKGCTSCHVREGDAQKVHAGKKVPFLAVHKKPGLWDNKSLLLHKNCIPCHKKVKATLKAQGKKPIHLCKNCHKKK